MGKANIKKSWANISSKLIDRNSRERTFIFLTSFIFSYITLGSMIVNFVTKINNLAFFTLGFFIAFLLLTVLEGVLFTRFKKLNNLFLSAPLLALMAGLVVVYLLLSPARIRYILWICVIPVCLFLTFGIKRGIIGSSVVFATVLLFFYVPVFSQFTNLVGSEDSWNLKSFFIIYYVLFSSIGVALSCLNISIIRRLDELKNIYYEDANTDSLTGLRNQAYYLTYVNGLPTVVKEGDTIGLMFIDIDDFKLYNDKYGHTIGNDVLVSVANKLNEVPHALCVRWGGDEFAIVERNITRDEFIAKANYLSKSVAGLPSGVTISIGLAYFVVDDNFNFQKVFKEADMQAIRAKGKGKNCIVIKEDK